MTGMLCVVFFITFTCKHLSQVNSEADKDSKGPAAFCRAEWGSGWNKYRKTDTKWDHSHHFYCLYEKKNVVMGLTNSWKASVLY